MTPLPLAARRLVWGGPVLLVLGLGLSLITRSSWAGALVLLGFVAAGLGLHRLGRSGADKSP